AAGAEDAGKHAARPGRTRH
ncbi:MAG: Nucleoid-associated protein YaaK, partial [uncultured Lysobacter sp.]